MVLWCFMLIMDLLIPFTMIYFGKRFMKNVPKEINAIFGYRTKMSMINRDTWIFAHHYGGKLWYILGLILLPLSIFTMMFILGKSKNVIGIVGGVLCGVQL